MYRKEVAPLWFKKKIQILTKYKILLQLNRFICLVVPVQLVLGSGTAVAPVACHVGYTHFAPDLDLSPSCAWVPYVSMNSHLDQQP